LEDVGLASVVLESMDPFVWVTYPNAILRRKNPLSLCSCVSVFFRILIFETIFFPTKRFRCLTIFTFHEKKVARFCPSVVCVLRLWINNFFTGNSQGCGVPIAKSRIETF
jgi:hypothetical protein